MNIILIIFLLVPMIILAIFTYAQDRVEKEPFGLLLTLFILGIAGGAVTFGLQSLAELGLKGIFRAHYIMEGGKMIFDTVRNNVLYNNLDCFLCTALIQESVKLAVLLIFTFRIKDFNSLFDGLVYSIAISLGTGVFQFVLSGITERQFSVEMMNIFFPVQMFSSLIIGIGYSLFFKMSVKKYAINYLYQKYKKEPFKYEKKPVTALIITFPIGVYMHGFLYYSLRYSDIGITIGMVFTVLLYVAAFFVIYGFSYKDRLIADYVTGSTYAETKGKLKFNDAAKKDFEKKTAEYCCRKGPFRR